MTKPSNFILTTDYATLKNDATGTISVTLPSTASISGSTTASWTSQIAVGTAGAPFRSRMYSTKDGTWYPLNTVVNSYSGATVGGFATPYEVYATVHRISPTTLRLTAFIPNPYGSTMSVTGLAHTITVYIATFLPPFE